MKTKILSILCINILLFSLFCFNFQEEKIERIPTEVVNYNSRQKVIVIDAGHQKKANTKLEPIGPGAKQKKMKVAGGATGKYTKQKEYDLNLKVAKLLEKKLKAKGYRVIMIRTKNDVNISNSKRAKIAKEQKLQMKQKLMHLLEFMQMQIHHPKQTEFLLCAKQKIINIIKSYIKKAISFQSQ